MSNESYFIYTNNEFERTSLSNLAKKMYLPPSLKISSYGNNLIYTKIWSARLSTGLFGLPNCASGNKGPKQDNEIILAKGSKGLIKLVELGFIPCPTCYPMEIPRAWEDIKKTVNQMYGFNKIEDYIDKRKLPFDSRRLNWEEILPIMQTTPERIYLPPSLRKKDLEIFQTRFKDTGFDLPKIGSYNPHVKRNFKEYILPK